MSKRWQIIRVMIIVFVASVCMTYRVGAEGDVLSVERAAQIALAQVVAQVANGAAPQWVNAVVSAPMPYYDLQGEIVVYVFSVLRRGEGGGYVTVSRRALPNPVLEFSTAPAPHLRGLVGVQTDELITARPLYLGALAYFYEVRTVDRKPAASNVTTTRRFVAMGTGYTFELDNAADMSSPISIPRMPLVNSADLATLSSNYIQGVPDYNQFWYGSCYVGCGPTAMGNVVGYWDGHGYPNLVMGDDWQEAVRTLNATTGTYCEGSQGWTEISRIASGYESFVQGRGYQARSEQWCDAEATFAAYTAEIAAGRPLVVAIINHNFYGSHGVTGVGYQWNGQYMVVRDNWDTTPADVYLQYGTGYSSICFFSLVMSAQATPTALPTWTPSPSPTPYLPPPPATATPWWPLPPTPTPYTPEPPATATPWEAPYPPPANPDSFAVYLPLLLKPPGQYHPPYPPPATATVFVSPTASPASTLTPSPSATMAPSPTPSPLPSPTRQPTTAPCYEAVVNGDVESHTAWVFGSTSRPADYSAAIVHSGAQALRLGITDMGDIASSSSAWQDVYIPSDARVATLAFYYYPVSADFLLFDYQEAAIYDTNFNLLTNIWHICENSVRWRLTAFDLLPYRGNTVRLYFNVRNDGVGGATTALYVDDVSVQICR